MREQGFTLVETLIALAVFAIAGIALLQVSTQAARSANDTEVSTLGRWTADTLLAEALLDDELTEGVETGRIEQGGVEFVWTRTVERTQAPNIVQVRVDLAREDNSRVLARMDGYGVIR